MSSSSPSPLPSLYIPTQFLKSCQAYDKYPRKLVGRSRYGVPLLELCQERFQNRQQSQDLFVPEKQLYIPYWDVLDSGLVEQRNLLSEVELGEWLGDSFQQDPADQTKYLNVRSDPLCRFIFLVAAGSTQPLELTPAALQRILSYFQVMPSILNFLYAYGGRNGDDRELRFSGFRTEKTLADPNPGLVLDALNRSGKRYQMCYNLKTVAVKDIDKSNLINMSWKIRQASVYHQFDVEKGTQSWIIGDPLETMNGLVREHIHEERSHAHRFGTIHQAFRTSIETHMVFTRWACEEWRWHIESSEEIIENITYHFIDNAGMKLRWEPQSLTIIQKRDEKLRETITALEANAEIMDRLKVFYVNLVSDQDFPTQVRSCATHSVNEFASQMDEYIYDTRMQIKRAKVLSTLVSDRKQILIQHLQAQTAARQEELTARQEKLAKKAGLEAIAVRIITVITLFYLPATFVSTFFSTNAVTFQNDGSDDSTSGNTTAPSQLALERFFEVSVPLMALTFGLAIAWYYYERRQIRKQPAWMDEKHEMV
ncbi:Uu.00g117450.m01.CDS01 [Anthostomella pinea]|uniref:Uu.00g117450.m01.CDS01 n=1 Tax=Anthostomella pinea TaxID=933095 RepID=A0AAI8YGY4_9PEZI|nr:Uu.00g117450.m01.CDS01 [Anthostomella pinea]